MQFNQLNKCYGGYFLFLVTYSSRNLLTYGTRKAEVLNMIWVDLQVSAY